MKKDADNSIFFYCVQFLKHTIIFYIFLTLVMSVTRLAKPILCRCLTFPNESPLQQKYMKRLIDKTDLHWKVHCLQSNGAADGYELEDYR